MPVPLFKHHFCRRDAGSPKAHAHAAYLSGTKLDDGYGHTADFTPKGGILHAELWTPTGAPDWAKDRGELWRRLEAREDKTTRKAKAILAHKFIGALPHELSLEENIRYVKDYVREQFTRKGYAADWAIHGPDPGSDSRNFHVHIMVPLRQFENGDWARTKDRFPKNSPALSLFIKEKQQAFFDLQNRYLKKNGIEAHIHRHKGRWTVAEGEDATPERANTANNMAAATTSTVFTAMHGRSPAPVTQPIARPSNTSSHTLSLGGSGTSQSLRDLLSHAKRGTTASSKTHTASFKNIRTKSWPPAALADWAAWGSKNPRRFFALWPELSTGSPSPGGGM